MHNPSTENNHMDSGTVKGEQHQTIELRSISIMRRKKGAAPDDRDQIYMDYLTPDGGCARR